MTDPAEAAAERADLDGSGDPVYWSTTRDAMVAAAHEMAQPIRDLIERCEEYGDELDIDDLKKLVYPKEELS